jgi:hypothetical protein
MEVAKYLYIGWRNFANTPKNSAHQQGNKVTT